MSKKFHVNPETGVSSVCVATEARGCKYGLPLDLHFKNQQDASKAYEANMQKLLFKNRSRKKLIKETNMSDVLDIELLNKMIKGKYVASRSHPDDDSLRLLCYTTNAQIEGKWNDITKMARGLIVQSSDENFNDGIIVQRPWSKFFTLSQMDGGWHLGDDGEGESKLNFDVSDIDFDAKAEVTDKMDGSMGVLYRDPSGKPSLATKGAFTSPPAIKYSKMLQENEKFNEAAERLLKDESDTTFTFELVGGGESQIVLEYGKDDISMIGAIKKQNGLYRSVSDYNKIWSPENGLSTAEVMPANTLNEAFALPDRSNREGVVIRVISDDPAKQVQIKVKQDDYLKLHRLRTLFSKGDARKAMYETPSTYQDFIDVAKSRDIEHFPTISATLDDLDKIDEKSQAIRFREQRVSYYEKAILTKADEISGAYEKIQTLSDDYFTGDDRADKKRFFEEIKDTKLNKGILLNMFSDRMNGKDLLSRDSTSEMRKAASNV